MYLVMVQNSVKSDQIHHAFPGTGQTTHDEGASSIQFSLPFYRTKDAATIWREAATA